MIELKLEDTLKLEAAQKRTEQLEQINAALLAACDQARNALIYIDNIELPQFERGWKEEISQLDEAIAGFGQAQQPQPKGEQ